MKRFFFVVLLFLFMESVFAASTCDYSEQVSLQRAASHVKMNYEIRKIWYDQNGNVVDAIEGIENNALYTSSNQVFVYFLNITENIVIEVEDESRNVQTFSSQNSLNGMIEFNAGSLSNIRTYKVRILSNSDRCMGDNLRNASITTPMYNIYHEQAECKYIPNYEYCKEFITSPILVSGEVVKKRTGEAYNRYLNNTLVTGETKDVPFWGQIEIWFQRVWIYFAIAFGILFIIVIIVVILVVRNRKKQIL